MLRKNKAESFASVMVVDMKLLIYFMKVGQNVTFGDVLHESNQKPKQTLKNAQYGRKKFLRAHERNMLFYYNFELIFMRWTCFCRVTH